MKTTGQTIGATSTLPQNLEQMIQTIAQNPKLTQSGRQWLAMETKRQGIVDFDTNGTAVEENPHGFDPELAGLI